MISVADSQPSGPGSDLVEQVEMLFSPSGIFSKAKNFEYRPQQQQMAVAVAHALVNRQHLVVEAGTGVGKSLAYLAPAILFAVARQKKAIISTNTINLQEQLTQKDLPLLEKVLPVRFSYTMLKGRGNYLCSKRLAKAMQQADSLFTSPRSGGIATDLRVVQENRGWQPLGFRNRARPEGLGACLLGARSVLAKICGQQSEFAQQNGVCFFQRARKRILSADVLVVNHTLFFTLLGGIDEEEVEGGLLFKNDFVVFDKAHTVESVASRHIGLSVSSGQLRYGLQRLWNPRTEKGILATLRQGAAVTLVADLLRRRKILVRSTTAKICVARQRTPEGRLRRERRRPAFLDGAAHPAAGHRERQCRRSPSSVCGSPWRVDETDR